MESGKKADIMSEVSWQALSSDEVLDFLSEEYRRLEAFKPDLGERFFEEVEKFYERLKVNPYAFPAKTEIYRKGLIMVTKRLHYLAYFRLEVPNAYVDLILPAAMDTGWLSD